MRYEGGFWEWEDEGYEAHITEAIHREDANEYELVFDFVEEGDPWHGTLKSRHGVWYEGQIWMTADPSDKLQVKDMLACWSKDGDLVLLGHYLQDGTKQKWCIRLEPRGTPRKR